MYDVEVDEIRKETRREITTDYGTYTAHITIYESGKKHVAIYRKRPVNTLLDIFMAGFPELINEGYISRFGDWRNKIKSLIFEYEYDLYQESKLLDSEPHITIDYEAEAQKRRPKQQQEQQEEAPELKQKPDIEVKYWDNPNPETIHRSGQVQTKSGKPIHINSLLNLPQYRHLKNIK